MKNLQISIAILCFGLLAGCGGNSTPGSPQAVLQSIQVGPVGPSIAAGLSQQFTATGKYSDNSTKDLTNSVTWSSMDASVATISSGGMATSRGQGSTTIVASLAAVSGTATLTVTAPVLTSVAVSPASASLALGTTLQLAATGTFTDGSTKDVTNSSTWNSSNTSAAGVSSSGMVTSSTLGSTTITAAYSGISGRAAVTVTAPVLVSLAVSPTSASIAQSTTLQFTAMGTFTDGSMQNVTGSVQWTSTNRSVASINVNGVPGLAMGLAAGNSTITASSGSISSSAILTVTSATLVSIAVTPVNASIPLGTVQQFTATGTFSDGTTQNITDTVTWSSSKNSVASITVSGLASAGNLGTVTITAASGSVSGSTSLTVNAANLSSLTIPQGNVAIAETTTEPFSAIGTFTDGSTRDLTTQATWTSSNTAVATVGSSYGLAKGLSPGTTTITAAVGTVSASVILTVTNAMLVTISVTPSGSTIAPGTNLTFTATGTFSDSSTQIITSDSTWASDNVAVATTGGGPLVTAVGPGTANISATLDGVTGAAPLNVSSVTLVSIAVNPATAVLAPASRRAYSATGTFSDGSTQNITTAVTWASSDPDVASISSYGQVTGQSPGTATITGQLGSVSGTGSVVVESSALTSVQVSPASAVVAEQTGVQFNAIGVFADGSTENLTNSVSWTSSPISVATVSDTAGTSGLATGIAPGTATITALFAGEVGTASLTVTNAVLTSIAVSPSDASVALGGSQQFAAIGNFSDGTTENLTTQATWTSSTTNVATIDGRGLASAAGTGATTITASMNGVAGAATLTVY
ncbi:MAG: Ig-like domain-containing protein [Terriglobales bacterium]